MNPAAPSGDKETETKTRNPADVVIVGAGPVGLWAAIQMKKRNPSLRVQMYERYAEYKRSHVLRLEAFSLILYSKMKHDAAEKEFFTEVVGREYDAALLMKAKKPAFVRTNDLEAALKRYAGKLGVAIAYETVNSPDDVMAWHPECRTFIAADGAHSNMRKAVMGDDDKALDKQDLQYVIEMKYEARGSARPLGTNGMYKTNKLMDSMAFEYIGRERDGITPATVRFFVDKDTYDAMPEASFKSPVRLGDDGIPEKFAKDVQTLMDVRKRERGEEYIEGSAKLSKLALSHYVAKKFATTYKDRAWYLAGDAALGVPYFRSLNAGLIIASQLAGVVTQPHLSARAKIGAYNIMRPLDALWEVTGAMGKDMALGLYDAWRKANAKKPGFLQISKWKKPGP